MSEIPLDSDMEFYMRMLMKSPKIMKLSYVAEKLTL